MIDRFRQRPSGRRAIIFVVLVLLVFIGFALYYQFVLNKTQYILPPEYDVVNQTLDEVKAFLNSDDTDTIPYDEGFNCVDSVFRVLLNARWQGLMAVPIAIQYDELPGHMVIGFPIGDKGYALFETQNDHQIRLVVGQNYDGRIIRGFYLLDLYPVPLDGSPDYDTSMEIMEIR
jgi:hypothetical protein